MRSVLDDVARELTKDQIDHKAVKATSKDDYMRGTERNLEQRRGSSTVAHSRILEEEEKEMTTLLEKIKQKRMAMRKVNSRAAKRRKRRRAKPFLDEESEERLAFAVSTSLVGGEPGKSTFVRMSDETYLDEEGEEENVGTFDDEERT